MMKKSVGSTNTNRKQVFQDRFLTYRTMEGIGWIGLTRKKVKIRASKHKTFLTQSYSKGIIKKENNITFIKKNKDLIVFSLFTQGILSFDI
jgi:hypothetical protein